MGCETSGSISQPSLLPSPNAVALSCLPFSQSVIYSRLLSIQGLSLALRGCENWQPKMRIHATEGRVHFTLAPYLRRYPILRSPTFSRPSSVHPSSPRPNPARRRRPFWTRTSPPPSAPTCSLSPRRRRRTRRDSTSAASSSTRRTWSRGPSRRSQSPTVSAPSGRNQGARAERRELFAMYIKATNEGKG